MTTLIPKDHAEALALFRTEILSALVRRELDRSELSQAMLTSVRRRGNSVNFTGEERAQSGELDR